MMRQNRANSCLAVILFAALLLPSALFAADPASERALTIYTRDLATVSEQRSVDLVKGQGSVDLTGLLPDVVEGSATIEVLSGGELTVLSLQFNNNLFDLDKYWASRIGEMVTIEETDTTSTTGVLKRATSSHLFLEVEGALVPFSRSTVDKELRIDPIPSGLVTEPTLTLFYEAKKGGKRDIRLTYLAHGVSWSGVHRADLHNGNPNVTPGFAVTNKSGIVLSYTSLDLVAGEIHLAGDRRRVDRMNPKPGAAQGDRTGKTGDLRHWRIDTPGSLTLGTTSLHPLGVLVGANTERYYVYDATIFDDRVAAKLGFTLPQALPAGTVRVFENKDGQSLFTGEDSIDDTPAGSTLELTLGQVFDISAERIRTNEGAGEGGGTVQGVRVTLGNSGAEAVTVRVLERLFGDWNIPQATANGTPIQPVEVDARTARFDIPVGAGSTVTVDYEIRYAR